MRIERTCEDHIGLRCSYLWFYIYTPTRVEDQGIPNYSVVSGFSRRGSSTSANLTAVPTKRRNRPVIQEARALLAEQLGIYASRVKDEQG